MLSFAATVHAAPDKLPGEQIYAAVRPAMRWHMTEWDRIIAACWDGVLALFPALLTRMP
jgi:hypothetical protein